MPSVCELQKYAASIKNGSFAGEEALLDEWGNKITYVILSTNSYEFISMGKDGKMNTDDDVIWLDYIGFPTNVTAGVKM